MLSKRKIYTGRLALSNDCFSNALINPEYFTSFLSGNIDDLKSQLVGSAFTSVLMHLHASGVYL